MADTRTQKKIGKGRHHSAIKRSRQNETQRARNRAARSALKTAIRSFRNQPTPAAFAQTIPLVDKAASKGIIPRPRASRLVSRLARLVKKSTATAIAGKDRAQPAR